MLWLIQFSNNLVFVDVNCYEVVEWVSEWVSECVSWSTAQTKPLIGLRGAKGNTFLSLTRYIEAKVSHFTKYGIGQFFLWSTRGDFRR